MGPVLAAVLRLSLLGSLTAGALLLLRPLLRGKVSGAVRYYLWLAVLLRLCIPAGITVPLPARADAPPAGIAASALPPLTAPAPEPQIPESPNRSVPADPRPDGEAAAPSANPAPAGRDLSGLWTALWGAGAAISLGRYAGGYRRLIRSLRRGARPAPDGAKRLLRTLDPAGRVGLAASTAAHTPVLVGVLRPVIVLPEAVEPDRLEDILRHELTHARRHDLLYKWFTAAVTSLHWFNPLMIPVRWAVSRDCELSCDEAVVRPMDAARRRHYGETLLALAAAPSSRPVPLAVPLCEEKAQLKERLTAVAHPRKRGAAAGLLSLLLVLAAGGCALVSGAEAAEDRVLVNPAVAAPPPVAALLPDGPETLPSVSSVPGALTPSRSAYAAVLTGLVKDGVFPDGTPYEPPGRDDGQNRFSLCDVDGDGAEELVICCTTTAVAGHRGLIYGFDEASGTVYEALSAYPLLTFYRNGAVEAGWSHSQGYAGDSFWPYHLWQYDPETDTYRSAGAADAWDRRCMEEGFPAALDRDGDGMLYQLFLTEADWHRYQDPEAYVDGGAYQAWRDACIGDAEAVEIPYTDLTPENVAALTAGGEPYAFQVRVSGGRLLTVGLETSQPEADYFSVDRIRIYEDRKPIQTIETAGLPVPDAYAWDGLFVNRGYEVGEPDIRDLNFDGAEDFGLLAVDGYPHNVPYTYFLWNEAEHRFDCGFTLFGSLALETDPEHRRLFEFQHDSAAGGCFAYYVYEPDGSLRRLAEEP